LPANCRQVPEKSWRANREIKRYAGGSEHRAVADECVDAAGIGATDQSNADAAAEPDQAGSGAGSTERYDGTAGIATGSRAEAD